MALIKDESKTVFDLAQIKRGDCIRFQRAGDTTARNGFVTQTDEETVRVLYCNIQNNANSYIDLKAADVALGIWAVAWTTDFETIKHQPETEPEPEPAPEPTVTDGDGEVDDEL